MLVSVTPTYLSILQFFRPFSLTPIVKNLKLINKLIDKNCEILVSFFSNKFTALDLHARIFSVFLGHDIFHKLVHGFSPFYPFMIFFPNYDIFPDNDILSDMT